ncbi:MAG: hypothetical protein C5B58_01165 [Acidobacteria bacterium]|nr:MAG: hypothetical protein C5B58_01165 [Acidobacteriota bacterium]
MLRAWIHADANSNAYGYTNTDAMHGRMLSHAAPDAAPAPDAAIVDVVIGDRCSHGVLSPWFWRARAL